MKDLILICKYSVRLLTREWRRFVLPSASLVITGVVIMLMLLLTEGGSTLIGEKARELQGGDMVIESNTPIDADALLNEISIVPEKKSYTRAFTASLGTRERALPVSFEVVDGTYPLFGTITLQSGVYRALSPDELLLDQAGAERLNVKVGDTLLFSEKTYTLAGIVTEEPSSLFGGFRFFPRAFMSDAGFARAALPTELLRTEYRYAYALPNLTDAMRVRILAYKETHHTDITIAGTSRTGFDRSLSTVSDFLIIAVLITIVLGAANVYTSTVHLIASERKSFAVLLALGMRARTLGSVVGTSLLLIVIPSGIIGAGLGTLLFTVAQGVIETRYGISIPLHDALFQGFITTLLILVTTLSAFVPGVLRLRGVSPKDMLHGKDEGAREKQTLSALLVIVIGSLAPLVLLASLLLQSFIRGIVVIGGILVSYVVISSIFVALLSLLYRYRTRFTFMVRGVIAHKKADGVLGVISFTSLFIALTALATLALTQVSLTRYLEQDLVRTIPTTYVIDIQPSQKDALLSAFPDLTVFPNIRARIVDIDGRRIQDLVEAGDPNTDRELRREYNLTMRDSLLSSESITEGVWGEGNAGEMSVDREFAERANIQLGSSVTFLIQGFDVRGTVTSLRDTDSRSGLPFFYFVLSPMDVGEFPSVYFGYAYYTAETQRALEQFLLPTMPNVSVIKTDALAPIVRSIVNTLLTLVFLIIIPPLLIATLLIATIVVSSYPSRKKEGARLQALGLPINRVRLFYLLETIALTLAGAIMAYVSSLLVTYFITSRYLKLGQPVLFDAELFLGLGFVVLFVAMIGAYLFTKNRMPLRELLAYETNR